MDMNAPPSAGFFPPISHGIPPVPNNGGVQTRPPPPDEARWLVGQFLSEAQLGSLSAEAPFELLGANFYHMAQNFLYKRRCFQTFGKPILVQIAYHYTTEENIPLISREGLRVDKALRGHFGNGIYVANNPHAFRAFGEVGIAVLTLNGVQQKMYSSADSNADHTSVDSYVGSKLHYVRAQRGVYSGTRYFDETVLKTSAQTLPLIRFPRELTNNADIMIRFHEALQSWVDRLFPSGFPSHLNSRPVRPDYDDIRQEHKLAMTIRWPKPSLSHLFHVPIQFTFTLPHVQAPPQFTFTQPQVQVNSTQPQFLVSQQTLPNGMLCIGTESCNPAQIRLGSDASQYYEPLSCSESSPERQEDCPICLSPLGASAVALKTCQHKFHSTCLEAALKVTSKCPTCRRAYGEPVGNCPFGVMDIGSSTTVRCGGYGNVPTLMVRYTVPSGVQMDQHENPGQPFSGTHRIAYFPDVPESRDSVKRLRYAFRRGLTFAVGTSLTSGQSNVVVWASIHHKSNPQGGPHGWPDPRYFDNLSLELDALAVPKASDL